MAELVSLRGEDTYAESLGPCGDWLRSLRGEPRTRSRRQFSARAHKTAHLPYLYPDQDEKLLPLTHAHLGWCVRECIPYLILPVRQLSSEPSPRITRRSAVREPSGNTPSPSRTIRRSAERSVRQYAGPPRSKPFTEASRTIRRSDTSEPSGKPPGLRRTICRSDNASHQARRWACVEPHTPPREPQRTPRRPPSDPSNKPLPRSRTQQAPRIPNRTP